MSPNELQRKQTLRLQHTERKLSLGEKKKKLTGRKKLTEQIDFSHLNSPTPFFSLEGEHNRKEGGGKKANLFVDLK